MKTPNLIASAAAILFTFASLGAVTYHAGVYPAVPHARIAPVTNLAPVYVRPSAAELRAAALMSDATVALGAIPASTRLDGSRSTSQFGVLGSQLAMPYYSFGTKFGRISKE